MKNIGMKLKFILSSTLAITIILLAFYYWIAVAPESIATDTLNEFENAFYVGPIENAKILVEKKSFIFSDFEKFGPLYKKEFQLFKQGYKINKTRRTLSHLTNNSDVQYIWVWFSKVAKIDNKERNHFEALLVKDQGYWKILQYSFPDYIDY